MIHKRYLLALSLLIVLLSAAFTQVRPLDGRPRVYGPITSIDDNTLTIEGVHGSQTILMNDNTLFHSPGAADFGLADLQVGDVIFANGARQEDGSLLAAHVVLRPEGDMITGRVATVSADSLTLSGRGGQTFTVMVTADTLVARPGRPGLAWGGDPAGSELVGEGMGMLAFGTLDEDGTTLTAHTLILRRAGAAGRLMAGQVEAINGSEISLTNRRGLSIMVIVTADTRFLIANNPDAGLDDIAVGDRIAVRGQVDENGQTVTAGLIVKRNSEQ